MTRRRSFASAQQVADRAGVSRSAVSRTFTPGASVSDETRRRVLAAAEALGYHVNHLARGLTRRSSAIVCIVASDLETPLRSRMVGALTDRLQHSGRVAMLIGTSGRGDADARSALRQILNYRADATIVLSGTPSEDITRLCIAAGQRVVLINRDDHFKGSENLSVDNEMAAREAFFLLQRAGCRRLAVVSSDARTPALLERERVFAAAAESAGMSVSITRAGPTSYDSGVEAARRVFGRSQGPDGVFCVTDLLATGFMDAARQEFGLSIPDDLCIVGFDDIEQASWGSYNLTTFAQPLEQMADHVAALVGPNAPPSGKRRLFEPVPVWRKSVRPRPV